VAAKAAPLTINTHSQRLKKTADNGELCAMRIRGTHLSQILLGLALLAALFWNFAHAADVRWVQMDMNASGTRAEIGLDRESPYKILRLEKPARLAVDFPASRLGARFAVPPGMGVVRAVRNGQPVPGTVRIVFDLTEGAPAVREPRLERGPEGVWLVLEWPDPAATAASPTPVSAPPAASTSVPAPPDVAADMDDALIWPLGDPEERIIIPGQGGAVPVNRLPPKPLDPPPATLPPPLSSQQPASSSPIVEAAPVTPARPPPMPAATGPPVPALDPIAQIAAATQTGAAEQLGQQLTATPVAVSVGRFRVAPHSVRLCAVLPAAPPAHPGIAPTPHRHRPGTRWARPGRNRPGRHV